MGTVTRSSGPGRAAIEKMIAQSGTISKVGFFPSARYPDGTPIAEVAMQQEYGVPALNIPSRSFMRTTIDEQRNAWKKIVSDGSERVAEGKLTIHDVMEGVGGQAAGDCRKKIASIWTPKLSDYTIERRAEKAGMTPDEVSHKPLVDSGAMLAHLTHMTVKE